ncbi:MAG: SCP-2 sterol transfer family protein [Magnetococcales bacterium]|nr:SCP-2 sterol transfer family protein [Magnetococcales bacterium]
MAEIFSDAWMKRFGEEWNKEPELGDALAKIGFTSTIAYGFDEEDNPRGIIVVEQGKVTSAGAYRGENVNWDMRASKESWTGWMAKPPGMMGLGMAYTARKLKFKVGDYGAMVKDPRMAGPFIKSFSVMGRAG